MTNPAMVADFLPPSAVEIHDPEAIALLQHIQRRVVQVDWKADWKVDWEVDWKVGQSPMSPHGLEVNTAYVHYLSQTDSSQTAPILLLHGFDSSLLEFRRLLPLLAKHHQVWAIDLLGSGFTEYIHSCAINPQTIRYHLLSVIKTWIHQPIILVGASLGGAVAIDLALHYPDWVRSLVLMDSVGFSGSFPVGQFLPPPVIEFGVDWLYFRKHAALAVASSFPFLNPTLVEALRCSLLHQEMPGWKAAITAFTQSGGYANLGDRIAEITPPTLIMWGAADDVLGTTDAVRFEQRIAGSHLVWIEQAGHAPHLDQPQAVAAHLLAFAQKNRP